MNSTFFPLGWIRGEGDELRALIRIIGCQGRGKTKSSNRTMNVLRLPAEAIIRSLSIGRSDKTRKSLCVMWTVFSVATAQSLDGKCLNYHKINYCAWTNLSRAGFPQMG